MTTDMAVVTPLNNFLGPEGDTVTVDEQLLNTEYQAKVPGTVSRTKRSANFSSASQALFRVQEKHQIQHVWVSFHMFWRPTFFIDENCKITEPMHFWTWVLLRAFCTTFRRKRFIART